MRKITFLLVLLPIFIFGMAEPTGVPPEIKGINVVVVDKKGVKHSLRSPICDGESYLKVRKGALEYSISLRNIKKIVVNSIKGDDVELVIETKDGRKDTFIASAYTLCVMQSYLGNVSFNLKDVKEIMFQGAEK